MPAQACKPTRSAERHGRRVTARPSRPTQAAFAAALLDPARPLAGRAGGLERLRPGRALRRLPQQRGRLAGRRRWPTPFRWCADWWATSSSPRWRGSTSREHPPTSPVLTEYGDGFADWIAGFEPAAALPYLADMARLERARVTRLPRRRRPAAGGRRPGAPPGRPGSAACGCAWQLHPSLCRPRLALAVVSLWAAHQGRAGVRRASAASTCARRVGAGAAPRATTCSCCRSRGRRPRSSPHCSAACRWARPPPQHPTPISTWAPASACSSATARIVAWPPPGDNRMNT